MAKKSKYNGTFFFDTLVAAIFKIKNNLYVEPSRIYANQSLKETGSINYWDADNNHAELVLVSE